jgi:hypothetical protein
VYGYGRMEDLMYSDKLIKMENAVLDQQKDTQSAVLNQQNVHICML